MCRGEPSLHDVHSHIGIGPRRLDLISAYAHFSLISHALIRLSRMNTLIRYEVAKQAERLLTRKGKPHDAHTRAFSEEKSVKTLEYGEP